MNRLLLVAICNLFLLVCGYGRQQEQDSLLLALKHHPQQDTVRIDILNDLAFSLYTNDPTRGLQMAQQAYALAKKLNDYKRMAIACSHQGINYNTLGNHDTALKMYELAWKFHEKYGNRQGMAKVMHNMGLLYNSRSAYRKALEYHGRALQIFEEQKDSMRIPIVANSMGVNYMALSDYPQAEKEYLRALGIYQMKNDSVNIALTYTNIGIIHKNMGEFTQALSYHKKALLLMQQTSNKTGAANILGNMGVTYDLMKQYDKAIESYSAALKLSEEMGYQAGIASNNINLGITYKNTHQYEQAYPFLQKAVAYFRELGDNLNLGVALNEMGYFYANAPALVLTRLHISSNTRYQQAIACYEQALKLVKATGNLESQKTSWEYLGENYEKQRDFEKALNAYKNAMVLNDSILTDEKLTALHKQEMAFEYEKKEAQLKTEQSIRDAINLAQVSHHRLTRNIVIAGSLVLLIAAAFMFVLYKRKRDADQQKQEAELNAQVADTEMKALRAQMNPHFIFNSLNSISDYISKNNIDTANHYLIRFSKLMRIILQNSEHKMVTLAEDLKALELYMQLESTRFQPAFTYSIDIDTEIDIENTLIPPLILQPFVENSIWHGIANKENGTIIIRIRQKNNMVICSVEDNGKGISTTDTIRVKGKQSMGMKITQSRIDILNKTKDAHGYMSVESDTTGTRASITLPLELQF